MSHEPDDDASPRRRPVEAESAEPATAREPGQHRKPEEPETAEPGETGEPEGTKEPEQPEAGEIDADERKRRQALSPPVDPYADPLSGAGPYDLPKDDPEARGEDAAPAAEPVGGEAYHPDLPPDTEIERLKQYRREQDEEAPPKPPPQAVGRYPFESHLPTHPSDTIRQFSSLDASKPPRRRRSDWPVIVFALVVSAVLGAGCCLAGFAVFMTWTPFGR